METTELKADRELDALVAEKVMGLMRNPETIGDEPYVQLFPDSEVDRDVYGPCPHYSTSIADAWEIVNKLPNITLWSGERFHCRFGIDNQEDEVVAKTAPLSICLAALKVMEKEDAQRS